ncbi:MAG: AgmX/PglI C-terminal domain-containing protein [Gammaproteobacteria bacterium]|jgi:TonB family protein
MSSLTLTDSQPWAISHEEDRRFRQILLQTLLVCLAVGIITPYIRIPRTDSGPAAELPPRRVYLLAEQIAPLPRPASVPGGAAVTAPVAPAAPAETAPAESPTLPERPAVAPGEAARRKAASSGVMALSESLAELRTELPKTGAASRYDSVASRARAAATEPSTLTANLTRGSRGIEGGVAHQSVLGAPGLPERAGSRQGGAGTGTGTGTGTGAGTGTGTGSDGIMEAGLHSAASAPGMVRSKESIQEVLDRNKGAMYTLYNRELRKDATLQGKLVLSITIAPSGNVTRCVILSSELDANVLETQLVALIKRLDFGNKPEVPEVTTKIPIEFFPR